MLEKPAILGGEREFDNLIHISRPSLDILGPKFFETIKEIYEEGILTNGEYTRKFEEDVSSFIGSKNIVATSSGTLSLMITLKALIKNKKEVIIPSFTFPTTAHAIYWSGGEVKVVDCDIDTFNISCEDLLRKISHKTACIIGVHNFGNPCDIKQMEDISIDKKVNLIFDAAQALGSTYGGKKIGNFGDAEIFSTAPNKIITTNEGGVVSTNNDELARILRLLINYCYHKSYYSEISCLNGRMTEINALTGSFLMKSINKFIKWREKIAKIYHSNLSKIPGISFQKISNKSKTVNTFFPILINPSEFGIDRNLLEEALRYENIETRKYFYPPVHLQDCYKNLRNEKLPNTDTISSRIICLPIHNLIEKKTIKKICEVMHRIHNHSSDIKKLKVKK